MSEHSNNRPAGGNDDDTYVQRYTHSPVSARVPERVARGVFSTGQLVLDSPREFMIDFLQGLARPHQVVARVVVTPSTMSEFVTALRQNLDLYAQTHGPLPTLPPPGPNRPTLPEIYENFKLPDDMMSGTYANGVLIGHSVTEFFFDFITSFYPTSAVAARVYIAAPQAPRLFNTLETALRQHRGRLTRPPSGHSTGEGATPEAPPATDSPPPG